MVKYSCESDPGLDKSYNAIKKTPTPNKLSWQYTIQRGLVQYLLCYNPLTMITS